MRGLRRVFGVGTPRALRRRAIVLGAMLRLIWNLVYETIAPIWAQSRWRVPFRPSTNDVIACA
jgi:hypothetical protein